MLPRGPYVIAADLDESVAGAPKELRGRFVNLFDPALRLRDAATLSPAARFFLLDLAAARGSDPRVLASACKALATKRGADQLSLTVEGRRAVGKTQGEVCNPPARSTFFQRQVLPVTNMVDGSGTNKYIYASGGQLLTEDAPFANDTMTNSYSSRLRTGLSLAQPTGSWTNSFGFDSAKRLTNVTSQSGSFAYAYKVGQASRLPIKLSLPNTSYITNTYDSVARLRGTYLKNSSDSTLNSHEYTYNPGNQRTQQVFSAGSTYNYTYDAIGQLKIADSSTASEDRGYAYDTAWNLNYRTNNGVLATFKVDTKNQLTNATPAGNQTYDANGNLLFSATFGHGCAGYSYDDENRLVNWYYYDNGSDGNGSPTSPADLRTEFVYDGRGRLRKRIEYNTDGSTWSVVSETRYLYDGMRVIQEGDINNTPTVSYTRGTDLSGSLEGAGGIAGLLARSHTYSSGNFSTHNCYHADGNGNITYLVNSSQTLAASYRYDPYGNAISSSGSLASANVYRFSSKEAHINSGLYYYGYRWYDPNLQRRPSLGRTRF